MSEEVSAFISKYDKVQKYWHQLSSGKDGKIDLEESGLSFEQLDPEHPFVKEVSGIEDDKVFKKITDGDHMTHFAVRAYLWNKYPDFAKKWDSGSGWLSKGRDGTIQTGELKEGGFTEQLIQDIRNMISEQRDRELLLSRPLFTKPGLSVLKYGRAVDTMIQSEVRDAILKLRPPKTNPA